MVRWRIACFLVLCMLLWPCAMLRAAAGSSYYGKVTFNGLSVPGATVTATEGTKKLATTTDAGGVFHFDNMSDGAWTIEVEMQLFAPFHAQVTVGPKTPAGEFALTPLPLAELEAHATPAKNAPETPSVAVVKKPEERKAAQGNTSASGGGAPAAPPPAESEQSADGIVVNGSVNNAATSVYSTNPAFGNAHPGGHALYNGGFAAFVDNSAMDARPFNVTGVEAQKNNYTHLTDVFTLGGPLRIPHLMPNGPNFFVAYIWTRDNSAAIQTGLVPTIAERTGNLSGLTNAQGQPITVFNPATGQPYAGNQVPVSSQAAALLNLYPQPNITGVAAYNYQEPVLNDTHQDALQSHLFKSIGRKDTFDGQFSFQNTRSSSVNLFGFVDRNDTLGIKGNIHWLHRLSTRMFLYSGYEFSRLRTQLTPEFENRENISGNAGIAGNDQDQADWGPPTLGFTSGFTGLSDGNSEFNRNQTDAFSAHVLFYHGKHDVTVGGDYRREDFNDLQQQNPRGTFTFTGAATGSDLADFLIGVPDTSAIAYGNADKYFREPVYDAYFTDDWRVLPILTINAGMRWDYEAPITELFGRLVNLDIANGFTSAAPVLGSDPVGSITGTHYPSSLMQPDKKLFEPRVAISWRPIPASTVVVRAGYGIYSDTSVYLRIASQMDQQAPLSTSYSVQNSSACSLSMATFQLASTCPASAANANGASGAVTYAIDPNFHIGYAQVWDLEIQRDFPFAMQITATYRGTKGTHGPQEILPNSYPIGESNPCPSCPSGFVYETSNGNSTREEGQLQLRRRLMNGFAASVMYTWSKSIDDDAYLGGTGHVTASSPGEAPSAPASGNGSIAQNWLDPQAERSLSSFDQRQLVNIEAQYTSGEGLGGGTLMSGWRGRLLKEWTVQSTITVGSGLPETPILAAAVPGTGVTGVIRPDLTGAPLYGATGQAHVNAAAYAAPVSGEWGTAGRYSITGPDQFTLNSELSRTFRPHGKLYLDLRIESTNTLNHPAFSSWNPLLGSFTPLQAFLSNPQFGLPTGAGGMRNLQTVLRLRF
jgi:Carboxypeptidase regulatory-like domain